MHPYIQFFCLILCPIPNTNDPNDSSLPNYLQSVLYLFKLLIFTFNYVGDLYFCFISSGNLQIVSIVIFILSIIILIRLLLVSYRECKSFPDFVSLMLREKFVQKYSEGFEAEESETDILKIINVFIQDIPQFIIQMIYISHNPIDYIVVFSMISSMYAIYTSLLFTCYGCFVFCCGPALTSDMT